MKDKNNYIYGLHSVLEALEAGRDVDKIFLRGSLTGQAVDKLLKMARAQVIPVARVPLAKLDRITSRNHQGVIAVLSSVSYSRVHQVLPMLFEQGRTPFLVVLDGITDVRNFGAIARTCECAGVDAIVLPERGSVTVGADAMQASAGALNHIEVCREPNLLEALQFIADSGVKIVGTSDHNPVRYTAVDYTGPVALVLGSEHTGISAEVMNLCDHHVMIPEYGHINSLNVSVATGVMVYEVVRQRHGDDPLGADGK